MVDYSKWKDIEVSDDEDDTHPNIDTPSLFRWRHQARVERMEEKEKEKAKLKKETAEYTKKMEELKTKMSTVDLAEKEKVKTSLKSLEEKKAQVKEKEEKLAKEEKLQPWNVDTISHEGFSKTLISQPGTAKKVELTEEEKEEELRSFVKKHEKEIKAYGMFKKYEDSMKYLQEHLHLVCEHTANFLVVWCINLEMEEKHTLSEHVAHQVICMQFILQLASQLERHPQSCVSAFFHRIQVAEPQYRHAFNDELNAFKDRIRTRAAQKLEEALKEAREEERKERLGPGGLDPLEVMETLPQVLKDCFESQDVQRLKDTITTMDPKDATYHMKRCVLSGLWVPESDLLVDEEPKEETEEIYDTVD